MTLNDLMNEVARRADTQGLHVTAADTRRVIAIAFDVLYESDTPAGLHKVLAAGLRKAEVRAEGK